MVLDLCFIFKLKYHFALYLKQAHDIRDAKIKEILQEWNITLLKESLEFLN